MMDAFEQMELLLSGGIPLFLCFAPVAAESTGRVAARRCALASLLGGMAAPGRRVRCVETGEIFDSLSDAAKAKNLFGPQNLYKAIKCNQRAAGSHWRYVDEAEPKESA
eukprot:g44605.t1